MRLKMVDRLARRIGLSDRERQFLENLSDRAQRFRPGEMVLIAGEKSEHAYFVESGWAMTFSDFPDGSRQSRRLHFPGDIIGLPSVAMFHQATTVEAITDVTAAPFSKQAMTHLLQEFPRLTATMFVFSQEERITIGDRLCSLAKLPCKGRLAFLLMDVLTRLRAADPTVECTFEMHLTRERMADITGMTPVHASRMWNQLIAEGAIRFERPFVTIADEQHLKSMSNFVDRSADLDFTWLPPAN